jgi:hypothetical protein
MSEITVWLHWLTMQRRSRLSMARDERGDITQTVIIVALFAAAAIAISAIIINKFTAKANNIPTG